MFVYDELNFFNRIMNQIFPINDALSSKPTTASCASKLKECLKKGHLNIGMLTTIVGKFYKRKQIIPTALQIHHTSSKIPSKV